MYQIVKRYGHEEGLSCAFRQWRAEDTHCRFIHGYPLAFEFTFEGETLDDRNWLISFGELKALKQDLKDSFDHKTCIALDDPELATFIALDEVGLIQLNVVEDVGCEKFAELAYKKAVKILKDKIRPGVRIASVKVSEHGGNSALYFPPKEDTSTIEQTKGTVTSMMNILELLKPSTPVKYITDSPLTKTDNSWQTQLPRRY